MTRKILAVLAGVLALSGLMAPAASAAPATGDHGEPAVSITVNDEACGDWTFDIVPNRRHPVKVKYRINGGEWVQVIVDADEGYTTVDVPGPGASTVEWKYKTRHGWSDIDTFSGGHECPPPTTDTTAPPTTEPVPTTPSTTPPTTAGPDPFPRPVPTAPTCAELAAAGTTMPLTPASPDWDERLDGDDDGVACEGYVTGQPAGTLPRTGSTTAPLVVAGLGLVTLGGVLIGARRFART